MAQDTIWHVVDEMNSNTDGLTKDEAEEIIDAFDIFDKNGDGVIAGNEVGPILRILGQNPTEAEINKFVSSADLEGKGHITRSEFKTVIRSYIKSPNQIEQDLRDAFKHFDRRKTGSIDVKQLQKVLSIVGEPLSMEDTKQFLSLADTNKDGLIDVEEFVAALTVKI